MNRRDFVTAAGGSLALPLGALAATGAAPEGREFYELRRYQLLPGSKKELLAAFLREAAIPAWNRLEIGPVGVFTGLYGPAALELLVLLPFHRLETLVEAEYRLAGDAQYQAAGKDFLETALSDPAFARYESSLLTAFDTMPRIEQPALSKNAQPRIFELRVYESHSLKAHLRKVEMFDRGGEIQLFRETGLNPVMFGRTLIGPRQPNLTYLLCHEDMAARDRNWKVFGESAGWQQLRVDSYYADTVSDITDFILRPTDYSQL